MRVFVLWALVALLSIGCSSDNAEPPAELQAFTSDKSVSLKWQREVGQGTSYRPLKLMHQTRDDLVYVVNYDGEVAAYNTAHGERVWRHLLEQRFISGMYLTDELVILGSANGEVLALNQSDGSFLWHQQLTSEPLGFGDSPDGVVVVRSGDGKLHALNADSGAIIWQAGRPVPSLTLRGVSEPVVVGGLVVAAFDNGVIAAFTLDRGNTVWETRVAESKGRSEVERLVDVDGRIVVDGGRVYVTAYHGTVMALNLKDGQIVWTHAMSSYSGLVADERRLYVVDEWDAVSALDRESGRVLWTQPDLRLRRLTLPTVYEDTLVLGDFEGYVHVLNRRNGAFVARYRIDEYPLRAPMQIADDRVLALSSTGEMAALQW